MPDCTLCSGFNVLSEVDDNQQGTPGKCPLRDKCYRYTATPSPYRQSFFVTAPFVDKQCYYFWDNEDES